MAIKGNLQNFSITQLLNLINLAKKTGTLNVKSPTETAQLSFHTGKLAYAKLGSDDSLATILYKAKKINKNQYSVIKAHASNISDKELGLLLINANYLTQQEILEALKAEYVGVIRRLFTWIEGSFQFDDNLLPPNGKITLKIHLGNIIIEGTRRLREWEQLKDEIPSLDMALTFLEKPGTNLKNINLNVEEWRVVSYINPKNSIRQIAKATKMNDIEIRRIVYGLIQAGIVELVRPEGQKKPMPVAFLGGTKQTKEEQKSLITRIINRIRSL
ncbi:MAG TPA: DUF4388 domain-containing protein [Anaerolineae bacterium]|nr:DUF4388 domain-containing protein [Anaerolineae bacterium]